MRIFAAPKKRKSHRAGELGISKARRAANVKRRKARSASSDFGWPGPGSVGADVSKQRTSRGESDEPWFSSDFQMAARTADVTNIHHGRHTFKPFA
jgi:hypothetical protein